MINHSEIDDLTVFYLRLDLIFKFYLYVQKQDVPVSYYAYTNEKAPIRVLFT